MALGAKRGMRVPGVGFEFGAVRRLRRESGVWVEGSALREGGRFWRSSLGRRRRVEVK
jgi:hypothetical protein